MILTEKGLSLCWRTATPGNTWEDWWHCRKEAKMEMEGKVESGRMEVEGGKWSKKAGYEYE